MTRLLSVQHPLRNLDTLATTATGLGVQLVSEWQDLAQIEARYGRRAQTIINDHGPRALLGHLPSVWQGHRKPSGCPQSLRRRLP